MRVGPPIQKIDILLKHESRVAHDGISFIGTDVASDRAVVIGVNVPGKTPLIGGQKHPCIIQATVRIACIDCRTAHYKSMCLSGTAVILPEGQGSALTKHWERCRSAQV